MRVLDSMGLQIFFQGDGAKSFEFHNLRARSVVLPQFFLLNKHIVSFRGLLKSLNGHLTNAGDFVSR